MGSNLPFTSRKSNSRPLQRLPYIDIMKILKHFSIFLTFLILQGYSIFLKAQVKVDFKNEELESSIHEIFNSYQDMDSIRVPFFNGVPMSVSIYRKSNPENPLSYVSENTVYYNLKFDGDCYLLKKQFPLLLKLVCLKSNAKKIGKVIKEKSPLLVFTKPQTYYFSLKTESGGSYPTAQIKQDKLEELVTILNNNYKEEIVPTGDSVLIFQAVVNNDGSLLAEMELLYGKKDGFYEYFLSTYDYYMKDILTRINFREKLYLPYLQNGQRRGLIDIFVRLNPDKTFTIAATGEGRKLKLKNYQDDPNNPIFY